MPAIVLLLVLLSCRPALAHGGTDDGSAFGWNFDPWIVVPLSITFMLYAVGYIRLRSQARNSAISLDLSAALYAAGWLLLVSALVTPLHELGEVSFTAHMIEHEIVMAVAAPLLVLARPMAALLWGLPDRLSRTLARASKSGPVRKCWALVSSGATATLLHDAAIWGWHAPPMFDATVGAPVLHRLQHLSFFLTALIFWRAVLWKSSHGVAAWHLFVTMLHTSLLGALIALAPTVLYEAQTLEAARFGMTPLEDQQLAGILMWVPAGTIYAGAALYMLARCISRSAAGGIHGKH